MELSEQDTRQLQSGTAMVEYVGAKNQKDRRKGQRQKQWKDSATKGKPEAKRNNVGKKQM